MLIIGVFFICWLDRLLEGGSLRGSHPIIRFPMTKYLLHDLNAHFSRRGCRREAEASGSIARLIGSPTPDGLESGGLSLDLPGDELLI